MNFIAILIGIQIISSIKYDCIALHCIVLSHDVTRRSEAKCGMAHMTLQNLCRAPYRMLFFSSELFRLVCVILSNGGRIVVKNMLINAFFPALEREKHTNMELEKQRLSAEEENARQRQRSRQIEREKNMITRELNQRENENEYLVCFELFCHCRQHVAPFLNKDLTLSTLLHAMLLLTTI